MAYNNYFPMNYPYMQYQPQYQQQMQQQIPQQNPQAAQGNQTAGVNWVQGDSGARSWLLAPNQSVLLMDSESNRFFIKTADASGMPLPLRIFEYKELTDAPKPVSFVTKDEFEAFRSEVSEMVKKKEKPVKEKTEGIKDADINF